MKEKIFRVFEEYFEELKKDMFEGVRLCLRYGRPILKSIKIMEMVYDVETIFGYEVVEGVGVEVNEELGIISKKPGRDGYVYVRYDGKMDEFVYWGKLAMFVFYVDNDGGDGE